MQIPQQQLSLIANGSSIGVLTVPTTTNIKAGVRLTLSSNAVAGASLIVTNVLDGTHIFVKSASSSSYTGFDCSPYLVSDSAKINIESQSVITSDTSVITTDSQYQAPPAQQVWVATDMGPIITALAANTLVANDYCVLKHAAGDETSGITAERIAAAGDVSSDVYWFTIPEYRNGIVVHCNVKGATSGTFTVLASVRESGQVFGAGDPSTYTTVLGTSNIALVGGNGRLTISLNPNVSTLFRGAKVCLYIKPSVGLIVPNNGVVRFAVYL